MSSINFLGLAIGSETITNIASIATISGTFLVAWQIHSATKLNKGNLTFQKISEMDTILNKAEYQDIIRRIQLKNDHVDALTAEESSQIFRYSEENRQIIYDILNFFEALSAATLRKYLDEEALRQMAGFRIVKIYEKLKPFIGIIRKGRRVEVQPYQHYEELCQKWKKYYGGVI